jgi:probable rRNA maturation factor
MTIEITNKSGALAPGDQIQSLLAFAMSKLDLHPDCDLNVTFVDDAEMTELHIKWMDEPGSTDVLSFPMDLPETQGEIVRCLFWPPMAYCISLDMAMLKP